MINNALPDEKAITLQLNQGSKQAFTLIYQFYSPQIYRKIKTLVRSTHDAKEITQDVFVKLWLQRERINAEKSLRPYLYKISANRTSDFFRKLARDKRLSNQLCKSQTEEYSHVEQHVFDKENVLILRNAIDSLPLQRRNVLKLCRIEGKSYKEASEKLNISQSTIADHLVKSMRHLRNFLSNKPEHLIKPYTK